MAIDGIYPDANGLWFVLSHGHKYEGFASYAEAEQWLKE